jgi:hypothetical protein
MAHIYIHHTATIILSFFLHIFHSSRQAGCPLQNQLPHPETVELGVFILLSWGCPEYGGTKEQIWVHVKIIS